MASRTGLPFKSSAANAGAGFPTLSSRLSSPVTFWRKFGLLAKRARRMLSTCRAVATSPAGDSSRGEVLGKAGREFLLLVLAQALHQVTEALESEVEAAGVGLGHRRDDLRQRLDRAVGVGLQVLIGQILDLAEPVVLDGLVEERCVGLVTVVGPGVLLEVCSQLLMKARSWRA